MCVGGDGFLLHALYFPNIHEEEDSTRTSIRHGGNSPKLESLGVTREIRSKEIKFGS